MMDAFSMKAKLFLPMFLAELKFLVQQRGMISSELFQTMTCFNSLSGPGIFADSCATGVVSRKALRLGDCRSS